MKINSFLVSILAFSSYFSTSLGAKTSLNNASKPKQVVKKQNTKSSEFYIGIAAIASKNSYSLKNGFTLMLDAIKGLHAEIDNLNTEKDQLSNNLINIANEIANLKIKEQTAKRDMDYANQLISEALLAQDHTAELQAIALYNIAYRAWLDAYVALIASQNNQANMQNLLSQISDQIPELEALLEQYIANLNNPDLAQIKNSAESNSFGGSISIGYMYNLTRYISLGLETGVELGKVSIGSNSEKELELQSKIGFFANIKAGYRMHKNVLTYLSIGAVLRKFDINYETQNIKLEGSGYINQLSVGLGLEARITKNISMFSELNNLSSLNSIELAKFDRFDTNVKVSSKQVKLGARYYL